MSKFAIVFVTIAVLILLSVGKYISVKNTLVAKNEAVKTSWSQVDIVLQRRADLIPNLVETVRGYAKQEQTVFGDIAKARSQLLSAGTPEQKISANAQLDGALGRLLVISAVEIEREFSAFARRTGGHRKPHRGGASALQRHVEGLQHLCAAVPQQHLCLEPWLQTEHRLLCGF